MRSFCILGAGHGGMALAGHLGLKGFPVRLWSRNPLELTAVAEAGGVQVSGAVVGFGPVTACPDLQSAMDGADLILVAVPASAHRHLAMRMAPFLQAEQKVLLLPGRTAGAIEFTQVLRANGGPYGALVGEAQTFIYASRRTGPNQVQIHGIKRQLLVAALPAVRTGELLAALKDAFPQLMPARWVWKTSFDNIGAIFHPAVALMNAARIESTGGAFRHYIDGITESVAALLEQIDLERVAVARAFGVGALSAREWLAEAYGIDRPTLYEAIQATPAYQGVGAPASLDHRYVWEDVPTGLVPIAEFGRACGVPTATTDLVIDLANSLTGMDFRSQGRTLERLGMAGWRPEQIARYALEGDVIDHV
jgi:opine dehydrogenase